MPSPIVTAPFPGCGGTCDEIERCYLSCAQSTGYQINTCFCNLLSWPTACGVQCSQSGERSSLAAWYWDVCPSKMDSQLGQMGITKMQNSLKTVDDRAVPTPEVTTTLAGYECYYSSLCSGVAVATTSVVPGLKTGVDAAVRTVKSLLVKILVPVCLFALGLALFILYGHRRAGRHPRQPDRQDDDQMANLLHFIITPWRLSMMQPIREAVL